MHAARTELRADGQATHDVRRRDQAPRVLQRRHVLADARRVGAYDAAQAAHQVLDFKQLQALSGWVGGVALGPPAASLLRRWSIMSRTSQPSHLAPPNDAWQKHERGLVKPPSRWVGVWAGVG